MLSMGALVIGWAAVVCLLVVVWRSRARILAMQVEASRSANSREAFAEADRTWKRQQDACSNARQVVERAARLLRELHVVQAGLAEQVERARDVGMDLRAHVGTFTNLLLALREEGARGRSVVEAARPSGAHESTTLPCSVRHLTRAAEPHRR